MTDFTEPCDIHCTGWWEQTGLGRQPMQPLQLRLHQNQLTGAGQDIVGEFRLSGELKADGTLRLVKQYLGRHQVLYAGIYDGEGTLSGVWDVGFDHGRWLIRFNKVASQTTPDITDLRPPR
ncbi:MAG: hypothetical protein KDA89_04290 [Planctomycetaceae bacterium]|nr:hypothetical protein [Planctomycetaceae bacterium]